VVATSGEGNTTVLLLVLDVLVDILTEVTI